LATIFLFVAVNAWIALLPIYPTVGLKEGGADHVTTQLLRSAGTDINMPIALAIVAFLFAEFWGFRAHGLGYLREFIRFGGVFRGIVQLSPSTFFYGLIDAAIGALEALSHLVRLISFTFRLFGNMIAGEIVLMMTTFLLTFSGMLMIFYGLELLVGGVQALIFVGLTLVFTVIAVEPHDTGDQVQEAEQAAIGP
jgi:F-type H+-transporting ATPase subunit a